VPIPFVLAGLALAAGLFGVASGVEAYSNNSDANDYMRRAKVVYEKAQSALETQREQTASSLERLGTTKVSCWASTVGGFVHTFGKFKNVSFERGLGAVEKLHELQDASLKDMTAASLTA